MRLVEEVASPSGIRVLTLYSDSGNVIDRCRFMFYSRREAERIFRQQTGTVGKRLR